MSLASNLNASIDPQDGVPPFCQYLTDKVESSFYLYDKYYLEIVNIIKDFENGKVNDIPTIF